jgi:hypothetical protein
MWLPGPIGLNLCPLHAQAFDAFYEYLGLTVLEIYLLGWFHHPMTLV